MMTRRWRTAALVSTTLQIAAYTTVLAAGCGTTHHAVVTTSYAPAAYGVQASNGFDCYYIDDPAEATSMIAAGLCPAGSIPTLMPLAWHEMYYDYYASPAYYNTYVPVRYRTVWVSQSTSFYNTNKTTIVVVQKNATYKGSNGTTVKGIPSGGVTFGGGNRVAPTMGGGNARTNVTGGTTGGVRPAPSMGGGNARNPAPVPPKPVVPR